MIKIPITRRVLVEKNVLNSFNQLKQIIEQELGACKIYKYNGSTKDETFFYVNNNSLLLEAQINSYGHFYLNPKLVSRFKGNMGELELEMKDFVFLELFNINPVGMKLYLEKGSKLKWAIRSSKKII